MTKYRIYCVNKVSFGNHHHIESVGVRDGIGVRRFTVPEVYGHIDANDEFYVSARPLASAPK